MEAPIQYTYQLNAYFGIFYPDELISTVLDIFSEHKQYAQIATDDAEITIRKNLLIASTNSDKEESCSVGFIAVDDMTFGGPDNDNPEYCSMPLDCNEMEKRELKYKDACNIIADMYALLVKEFKKLRLPTNKLYHGWKVVQCTWNLDISDESEDSDDTHVVKKKVSDTKNNTTTSSTLSQSVLVPKKNKGSRKNQA